MKPAPLAGRFSRRMLPLALLAGAVVGGVVPFFYAREAVAERAGEATAWARQLADRLEGLARTRPTLWPYDRLALDALVEPLVGPPIDARVRLDTASHPAIYEAGAARGDAVGGWATVGRGPRAVGRVRVELPAPERAVAVWIGAPIVGLALAAGLFFLPLAAVRRGDARNRALWQALVEANASLEARVEARTAELRRREAELQALGARLVAVQEEERARISRDLHDDLGQVLTGLRLRLTALEAAADAATRPHLEAALEAVDDGVEAVRRLAHDLRPPALDALGLADAIAGHARSWAAMAGLEVALDLAPVQPDSAAAEVLFRVCQEALTNIARHADARRVDVHLSPADDGWRLVVEDDGRGFSPGGGEGAGLGLVGARERVEQAGGYLDLENRDPAPDDTPGGARVLVWLPADA